LEARGATGFVDDGWWEFVATAGDGEMAMGVDDPWHDEHTGRFDDGHAWLGGQVRPDGHDLAVADQDIGHGNRAIGDGHDRRTADEHIPAGPNRRRAVGFDFRVRVFPRWRPDR